MIEVGVDYSKDRKNDYTAEIVDGYVIRMYYAQTLCKRNHYTNAELCYHPSYMILYTVYMKSFEGKKFCDFIATAKVLLRNIRI